MTLVGSKFAATATTTTTTTTTTITTVLVSTTFVDGVVAFQI